jgi:hypothetical protein
VLQGVQWDMLSRLRELKGLASCLRSPLPFLPGCTAACCCIASWLVAPPTHVSWQPDTQHWPLPFPGS